MTKAECGGLLTLTRTHFFQPMVSGISGVTGAAVPSRVMVAGKGEQGPARVQRLQDSSVKEQAKK